MSIPVVVCGRFGRMAGVVGRAVHDAPDLDLAARLSLRPADLRPADLGPVDLGSAALGPGDADGQAAENHDPDTPVVIRLADVPDACPVVVDFTAEEATTELLEQAREVPCALVIGTSGMGERHRRLLEEVGRKRSVVVSANFSLALLAVTRFVRELAAQSDDSWDAGITDLHFVGKRDRPSGTARHLAAEWQAARGAGTAVPDIASFRMGDGLSEHRLLAAGTGEHVEVLHRMVDRRAFLPGILRSVRFAARSRPGVHTMEDVMGLQAIHSW